MKNINESNYFVIKRLDQEKKADSSSKVYNLKVLDTVKEVKTQNDNTIGQYCQSIIKKEDAEKIRYGEKVIILQAIKKAILSSNFSYKWRLKNVNKLLIIQLCTLIFTLICVITTLFFRKKTDLSSIINKEDSFVVSNTTVNFSDSINTNYTNDFINNSYYSNETNLDEENNEVGKYNLLISPVYNLILMILIWIIFFFKFIPQRDKINEIIYKFTRYLLVCESFENKKYYYHLMDDYSILVTKKDYFINNKESSEINEKLSPEKNIFSYCINYINDYLLEGNNKSIYYKLLSDEDKIYIILLREFIEAIEKQSEGLYKRIMISSYILLFSTYFYNKTIFEYINVLMSGMTLISFLLEYFINEYYNNSNEKKLDIIIEAFNDAFLEKKKFFYRRGKLIMLLTLKNNNYEKSQVIKAIEKIIDS